jgi:hypothetical protein
MDKKFPTPEMTQNLPKPPFATKPGMSWDMDRNFIYIFQDGVSVMTISQSEIFSAKTSWDKQEAEHKRGNSDN